MKNPKGIESAYKLASERYAELGVNAEKAMDRLAKDRDFAPLLARG